MKVMEATKEGDSQEDNEGYHLTSPSAGTRRSASIPIGSTFLPCVASNRVMTKVASWPSRSACDDSHGPASGKKGTAAESVAEGAVPQALTGQGPTTPQQPCHREAKVSADPSNSVPQPPAVSPRGISQLPPVPAAAHTGNRLATPSPACPKTADRASAAAAAAAERSERNPARPSWWATIGKGGPLYSRIQQAAMIERGDRVQLPQVQKHDHQHQQQHQQQQLLLQQRLRAQEEADRAWGQWGKVHQQKNGRTLGSMHSPFQQPLQNSQPVPGPRSPRMSLQQLEELMQDLLIKQEELERNILADAEDPSPADTRALVEVKKRLVKVGGVHQQERERQRLQQIDGKHQDEQQRVQHAAQEQQGQEQHVQLRRNSSVSCLQVPEDSKRAHKKKSSRGVVAGMSSHDSAVHPPDPGHPASPFSRSSWPSYTAAASAYATLAAQLSSQLSQPQPAGSASAYMGTHPCSRASAPLPLVPLQHGMSASPSVLSSQLSQPQPAGSAAAHMGAQSWNRASAPLPAVPYQHGISAHSMQPSEGASLPFNRAYSRLSPSMLSSSSDALSPSNSSPSPGLRVFKGLVLPQPVCQTGSVQSSTDLTNSFQAQRRFHRL